jgi:hypothetical protein
MTRTEQLEHRAQATTLRLQRTKKQLAQVKAQHKKAAQQARDKRYWFVGKLADTAGLLVLDDTTLTRLFQTLAVLVELPNPVAVLDALLHETPSADGADAGCTHPADGVAPAVPVGQTAR